MTLDHLAKSTQSMASTDKPSGLAAAFVGVTALFFTWGFITSAIDPLIPTVRAIFHLNYAESMLTQFAFFTAYFVVSLPGGVLVARCGYAASILYALMAMLAGCLFVPVATYFDTYALVLVALFVIAGGITLLQVAANPLAAALGRPEGSHFRLTLSQAINSLGTVIGPYFGTMLMLRGGLFAGQAGGDLDPGARTESLRSIDHSFLLIAAVIALLIGFVWWLGKRLNASVPVIEADVTASPWAALKSRWAIVGAAAIFLYVGAEVSIGSMMINFLHQPTILDVSLEDAGKLLVRYWLGAMIGRFIGSLLMGVTKITAHRLLTGAAIGASLLCLTVSQTDRGTAAYAALSIGLLNSIMFPTIFTLTLERSTAPASATSALLCMAIVGGAILPLSVGLIADAVGLQIAFFVPMAAYACIAGFAIGAGRSKAIP